MAKTRLQTTVMALIMSTGLGMAALAQETQPETDDTTGGSAIEDQLSLGEDADTPTDLGETYIRETNGTWQLRCLRTETPENDPCQMYQMMNDAEGLPVAEFSLFRLPEGGKAVAGATIIVPLETSLPQQVRIAVDGGNARRYPYAFCNQLGCYARIGFTDADIAAFKRGNEARIIIVPALAPDQTVELPMSLTGFTKTFGSVSVVAN